MASEKIYDFLMKPTAQELQDALFRKMSPDRKLEVAAGLWRLGEELKKAKHAYGNYRSAGAAHQNRQGSK